MNDIIRWGILGCGKIAHKFASDLKFVPDATLAAVAAREGARARAFAELHGVARSFDNYEAMASSPDVDVIYIATPHGLHHQHTMLCLSHGKAVLCEKAFALNTAQVKEMIATARRHNVFLMEAFWTRFTPQYEEVFRMVKDGVIGDIKIIQADFGFRATDPPAQRIFDPVLGGGSLLDIGLYPVFLAQSLLGKPVAVNAMHTPHATGVDEQCAMTMKFANGALAVLWSTFAADTPVEAMIAGTKGRIHMRNRFHNARASVELVMEKDNPGPVEVRGEEGFGYQFEARHVGDCLRKGLIESPGLTHADSVALMETLDQVRALCGIRYPGE